MYLKDEYFSGLSLAELINDIEKSDDSLIANRHSSNRCTQRIDRGFLEMAKIEYKRRTGENYVVRRERPAEPK